MSLRHRAARRDRVPAPVGARVPEHRHAGRSRCAPCTRARARRSSRARSPSRSRTRCPASRACSTIKSVSREEVSQITVEFVRERDSDAAANDVRDRVARVRAPAARRTSTSRWCPRSRPTRRPSCGSRSVSDRHTPLEITDYADRYVADRLKTLPGVASVIIGGERSYAMRIWLDRDRLAAFGLTPQDVETALRRQNVEIPAGPHRERRARVHGADRDRPAHARAVQQPDRRRGERLPGAAEGHRPRRARRRSTSATIVRVNGKPAVGLGIVKQSTANTLSVAQRGEGSRLPRIEAGAARGHEAQGRVRHARSSSRNRSRPSTGPWSRRCCWWCW